MGGTAEPGYLKFAAGKEGKGTMVLQRKATRGQCGWEGLHAHMKNHCIRPAAERRKVWGSSKYELEANSIRSLSGKNL